jgi:hypothetical protein
VATQRYISTSFWDDPWVTSLDYEERYLYLYLLTNPLTNIAGVYKTTLRRILFDTGLSSKKVEDTFDKFSAAGKAYMIGEYIVLPNWPKHQRVAQRGKILRGIRAILAELPYDVFSELERVGYHFPADDQPEKFNTRRKISKGLREKILDKYGNKCAFCGTSENLEIDHIKPVSMGGDNSEENLRVLCQSCNGKRNSSLRWNIDGTLSEDTHNNGYPLHTDGYTISDDGCPLNYSDTDTDTDTDTDRDSKTDSLPAAPQQVEPDIFPDLTTPGQTLARTWYKAYHKKTGKLIQPSEKDYQAAVDLLRRTDITTAETLIPHYFSCDQWFMKSKGSEKIVYSFQGFCRHFTELVSLAPQPRGKPSVGTCPDCGTVHLGATTCPRCGKELEYAS